jgi:hypothetical protein
VIYTPWSNLKKDGSMAVGQVGFKDNKKVQFASFTLSLQWVTKYVCRSSVYTLYRAKTLLSTGSTRPRLKSFPICEKRRKLDCVS